jgi:hypothetical protein
MKMFALICLAWSATFSAFAEPEESPEELAAVEKRVVFFQKNFTNFAPVKFLPATNSDTIIQVLDVQKYMFKYDGSNYCGFRFTVPDWSDGDFDWIFLLDKPESRKDFFAKGFNWYIIPETGRSPGFTHFWTRKVLGHPKLQRRFPYTINMTDQSLDRERLRPGQTYAIWFGFEDNEMVNIAFAMTIDSERGHREFGSINLN